MLCCFKKYLTFATLGELRLPFLYSKGLWYQDWHEVVQMSFSIELRCAADDDSATLTWHPGRSSSFQLWPPSSQQLAAHWFSLWDGRAFYRKRITLGFKNYRSPILKFLNMVLQEVIYNLEFIQANPIWSLFCILIEVSSNKFSLRNEFQGHNKTFKWI